MCLLRFPHLADSDALTRGQLRPCGIHNLRGLPHECQACRIRPSTGPRSVRPRPTVAQPTTRFVTAEDYVISSDEKSQLQALARRHPASPRAGPGRLRRIEFEYARRGKLVYLGAYDVHAARLIGSVAATTGIVSFMALVDRIMKTEPYASARRVFWVVDNGSSHNAARSVARMAQAWPTARLVHLPVHASWFNQKAPPESTKTSLTQRLNSRAAQRWPDLAAVEARFRANFAYIDGRLSDGTATKLCRLRYGGVGPHLGLCHLPGQPRRLPGLLPAQRHHRGQRRRSPRLRLRPLPQRPPGLAPRYTDELTAGPLAVAEETAMMFREGGP